jgi:hypothetical protein
VLDRVIRVTSIAAMEAYSAPVGYVFSLNAGGRSGVFDVIAGDFSTELTADTENGIYVGQADDPTATTKVAKRRIDDRIYLDWFGVNDGDDIVSPYSVARSMCIIEKRDLQLSAGSFFGLGLELIPGSKIYGAGYNKTSIDGVLGGDVFVSPAITATTLTQTEDLFAGDTTHTINNTASAGDFIRFLSTRRFTTEWDGGIEIRPAYVDGEILQIRSATATEITFMQPVTLNFLLSTSADVEFFTPHEKGGIFDLKVKRNRTTITGASGIHVDGFDGFEYDNIETENFNAAGIRVYRTFYLKGGWLYAKGGTADLGLDYGISINDGCKYAEIQTVIGSRCRHAIAGGGSGYAVSMFVNVQSITATDGFSHGADAHANTAYFHYEYMYVEDGFSMSGIGHSVGTAICMGGTIGISYEGGVDFSADKIIGRNIDRIYSNKQCHRYNIRLNDIELSASPTYGSMFKPGSTKINIGTCSIKNKHVSNAANTTAADSVSSANWLYGLGMRWPDSHIDLIEVQGFPVGVLVDAERCSINRIKVIDCAWSSAFTTNSAAILLDKGAEGSVILSGNAIILNTALGDVGGNNAYLGRVLKMTSGGSGSGARITIANINTEGTVGEYYYGASITASYTELFLQNNRFDIGSGGNFVEATGKFIFNTIVADN